MTFAARLEEDFTEGGGGGGGGQPALASMTRCRRGAIKIAPVAFYVVLSLT